MPNRGTHIGLEVISSFISEAKRKGTADNLALLRIAASGLGAILPDVIEPALNPRHRKFFHSVLVLAAIATFLSKFRDPTKPQEPWQAIVEGLSRGYLRHLCFDFCTPACLPLLGLS